MKKNKFSWVRGILNRKDNKNNSRKPFVILATLLCALILLLLNLVSNNFLERGNQELKRLVEMLPQPCYSADNNFSKVSPYGLSNLYAIKIYYRYAYFIWPSRSKKQEITNIDKLILIYREKTDETQKLSDQLPESKSLFDSKKYQDAYKSINMTIEGLEEIKKISRGNSKYKHLNECVNEKLFSAYYDKANILYKWSPYLSANDDAIVALTEGLNNKTTWSIDTDYKILLAFIYQTKRDTNKAIESLNQVNKNGLSKKELSILYYNYGVIFLRSNQDSKAKEYFNKAIVEDPNNSDAKFSLENILY